MSQEGMKDDILSWLEKNLVRAIENGNKEEEERIRAQIEAVEIKNAKIKRGEGELR